MEALSEISEAAWNTNHVPVREMGFDFGDPLMAGVLSVADQEGFDWFPYAIQANQRLDCQMVVCSRDSRIQHREAAQAQNIYDRVFAQNPEARLVLYVGLRHLDEALGVSENGFRNGWMAAALAELTGYDPLTIDQVSGAGIGPKAFRKRREPFMIDSTFPNRVFWSRSTMSHCRRHKTAGPQT